MRSPALGLWKKPKSRMDRDDIVVFEVMARTAARTSWDARRRRLQARFHQREIVVRAISFEKL